MSVGIGSLDAKGGSARTEPTLRAEALTESSLACISASWGSNILSLAALPRREGSRGAVEEEEEEEVLGRVVVFFFLLAILLMGVNFFSPYLTLSGSLVDGNTLAVALAA